MDSLKHMKLLVILLVSGSCLTGKMTLEMKYCKIRDIFTVTHVADQINTKNKKIRE